MKTPSKQLQNQTPKTTGIISIVIIALLAFGTINAQTRSITEVTNQERTIKGIVSTDEGPLSGVNILLKGTLTGTSSGKNGTFTFPKSLHTGDILVFSYLGYETQEVEIKEGMSFIKLTLTNDLIEIIGALDSSEPYKSKHKN